MSHRSNWETEFQEIIKAAKKGEPWFTKNIIIPLFKAKGYGLQYTHGPKEISHKTDALAFLGNDDYIVAVQVKVAKNIRSKEQDIRSQSDYGKIAEAARNVLLAKGIFFQESILKETINTLNSETEIEPLKTINQQDLKEIESSARKAITHLIVRSNKTTPVSKFYWITTGKKGYDNSYDLEQAELNKWPELRNRVEIWDIDELYQQLCKFYPHAFTNTSIDYYKNLSGQFKAKNSFTASFCSYKAMTFCLKLKWRGKERVKASEAIETAIKLIEKHSKEVTSPYYWRTIKKFQTLWQCLINTDKLWKELRSLLIKNGYMVKGYETKEDDINKNYILSSSLSELFEKRTGEKEVKNKYQLLIDVQYIIDHLNVLNINYVDAPAGLSSLQIVRLLLRTGFPYINDEKKSIHRRFERIVKEMDNTNIFKSQKNTNHDHGKGNSIDGACTICTATAVSCFALAGEALPENFSRYKEKALTWLSQDNMYKWNWIYIIYDQLEALPYNHAMNYTSSVLLSFLDSGLLKKNYDNANDTNIQLKNTWRCFDTFFETKEYEIERNSPDKFKNGFIEKWMQHRNERPEEVLQYILSTFIKVCLCFPEKFRKNEIIKKISAQIKYLYILLRDISDEKENIWRLYTARENIECLCFMMLLGKDSPILPQDFKFRNSNNYRIIIKAATDIIERFRLQIKHQTLRESRIFDSNIDRSRKFLEGWLTYWEVTLFLSEKN